MYHYHNQQLSPQVIKTTPAADGNDLFLLFDKFPQNSSSISIDNIAEQQPVSTSSSANASPYMSEKECTEQVENEDSEFPSNFNSKSRRTSLNKAERRAEHNAIERARRECLNSKFQQLAEALPNLQNHRRPSKGQIVEKALDWVKQNMSKEDRYQYQIMQLQNENKRLLTQVNIAQQQQQQDQSLNGIVSPPMASASPNAAPFPIGLRHQQFPANSTPTATEIHTGNERIRGSHSNTAVYFSQEEEMKMMYPLAPTGLEWHHQSELSSGMEYIMPSASSSSSSSRLLFEDDDESNSSSEEHSSHHIQFSYNDASLFEVNKCHNTMVAPWAKIQHSQQYPSYQSTHPNMTFNTTAHSIHSQQNKTSYSS